MAHARIIRDLLEHIAIKHNYTNYDLIVTPLNPNGSCCTSRVYTATISGENDELAVFVKVASAGEKIRSISSFQEFYDVERLFYTKIAKIFRQIEEKKSIPKERRIKVPIFYGCNGILYEETIVLENLIAEGYTSYDRFEVATWEFAAAAFTELAKYHALSVAFQEEDPEGFETLRAEMASERERDIAMKLMWDSLVRKAIEATKEDNKEILERFIHSHLCEWEAKLSAPGKLAVIGHGDYKPSNLMHKIKEDGTVEVIAVDYQAALCSSPVVDLLHFIITGTDEVFRAHYYQKLIDHYYCELRAAITILGLNPDEKYSRQDFDNDLREKLPFSLGLAIFSLPIATAKAEHSPKADEDTDISVFVIEKTTSLFRERFNGIVDDFIRWGII